MEQQPTERKCPACHGNNLVDGELGTHKQTFIPQGRFMWLGYNVSASVCLDCGFVAHYLDEEAVADIRQRGKSG